MIYPITLSLQKKAKNPWEKEDSRKNGVDNEHEIPRKMIHKERGKDHGSIGGKEIEDNMTDQNQKTDLIEIPKNRVALKFS